MTQEWSGKLFHLQKLSMASVYVWIKAGKLLKGIQGREKFEIDNERWRFTSFGNTALQI